MYQINNEKFGQFLAEVRKEKQMTQKDLADKLFVSDKTVSKWERGNSMPNVTLLIPIADVLGITVTELLQGEKLKENKTLNSDVVETLVVNSLDLSLRDTIRQRKKNWIFAFLISIGVVVIEAILLTVSGISIEQMGDSLYISLLMLLFASWLCIFAKELLPTYYDTNKVNFVSQGIFRIHMAGLSFNNANWGYVLTVFRVFTLGTAILYPILMSSRKTLQSKDADAREERQIHKGSSLFKTDSIVRKEGYEERYDALLQENQLLFTLDLIKEKLNLAYSRKDEAIMAEDIISIMDMCKATGNPHFLWFERLLSNHFEGIIAHATYDISAAKIEGINNKIKTLRRQGYGYPDDEYFFLKLFDMSRQSYERNRKSHKICD